MWIYRRLAKISRKDKKTNQEECDHLGTKREIAKTTKTRKIKYFGHIKRHTSFLKDVLEGNIEGSRPRGRQRRQWVDDIAEWTGKGIRFYPTPGTGTAQRRKGGRECCEIVELNKVVNMPLSYSY
ncbi:UDP-glucuronosyltransferase 2A1-like [Elysia marginata]|uniref:UDP-glucuronosyltransferase 2A1-like n=1 Tax=Elysia marginata TaxID=1093978 RepID=A0AAV4J8G0_9GAST|nr:UDP-glucuronosyltransferase 2A1-like [Elysia marginata]